MQVQDRFSITQPQLIVAQQQFQDDPEVGALMGSIKTLFFGDEQPDPDSIQVPEGMTADRFYAKFSRHVDLVEAAFRQCLAQARENAPPESRAQYFEML